MKIKLNIVYYPKLYSLSNNSFGFFLAVNHITFYLLVKSTIQPKIFSVFLLLSTSNPFFLYSLQAIPTFLFHSPLSGYFSSFKPDIKTLCEELQCFSQQKLIRKKVFNLSKSQVFRK